MKKCILSVHLRFLGDHYAGHHEQCVCTDVLTTEQWEKLPWSAHHIMEMSPCPILPVTPHPYRAELTFGFSEFCKLSDFRVSKSTPQAFLPVWKTHRSPGFKIF